MRCGQSAACRCQSRPPYIDKCRVPIPAMPVDARRTGNGEQPVTGKRVAAQCYHDQSSPHVAGSGLTGRQGWSRSLECGGRGSSSGTRPSIAAEETRHNTVEPLGPRANQPPPPPARQAMKDGSAGRDLDPVPSLVFAGEVEEYESWGLRGRGLHRRLYQVPVRSRSCPRKRGRPAASARPGNRPSTQVHRPGRRGYYHAVARRLGLSISCFHIGIAQPYTTRPRESPQQRKQAALVSPAALLLLPPASARPAATATA